MDNGNEMIEDSQASNTLSGRMLSQIAYHQISGNYWYGIYGEFNVVLMKDCGYVNVTKLCADGGKRFSNQDANKTSQALIHALEDMLGMDEASDFNNGSISNNAISFKQRDYRYWNSSIGNQTHTNWQ